MKTLYLGSTLLALSLIADAQAGIILEKVTYAGETLPSYAINKHCTINDNGQLNTEYQLNSMSSKRTQVLKLSKITIKQNIDTAALAIINTDIFPVDGETILYRAYQKQMDGTVKTVLLYEENGSSGEKKVNASDSAIALRNFIDLNCGDALRY